MWESFTVWDYIVGSVFLLSTLFGLFRGLISTVFGLIAWASAVFAAWLLTPDIAQALQTDAPTVVVRVGVFIAVYVAVRILGFVVARSVSAVGLGSADKPLGALFGAMRAAFIVAVLIVGLQWTGLARWVPWEGSVCAPLLDTISQWAKANAPRVDPSERST